MRFAIFFIGLCFVLSGSASAQVYADITVSHGGATLGTFRVLLHHERAPRTVAHFVGLARGEIPWIHPASGAVMQDTPYYQGLAFHRLIHHFMIQGGDPLGTGSGGPGYSFTDEFHQTLRHGGRYVVSMANSGPNTNGSQFFITLEAASHLDDRHSVFGEVIDHADVPGSRALIDGFANPAVFPTSSQDRPLEPIVIESVVISGPDAANLNPLDPEHAFPRVSLQRFRLHRDQDESFLEWDRLALHDYPVHFTADLTNGWFRAGNVISMDAASNTRVNVEGLTGGSTAFFSFPAVDYSVAPHFQGSVLSAGNALHLEVDGGELRLLFHANSGGAWTFLPDEGEVISGEIIEAFVTGGTNFFPMPETGFYVDPNGGSYARNLSSREITVFLDGPFGPYGITAIEPLLSLHRGNDGVYRGPVNSHDPLPTPFSGRFTWIPPVQD